MYWSTLCVSMSYLHVINLPFIFQAISERDERKEKAQERIILMQEKLLINAIKVSSFNLCFFTFTVRSF